MTMPLDAVYWVRVFLGLVFFWVHKGHSGLRHDTPKAYGRYTITDSATLLEKAAL